VRLQFGSVRIGWCDMCISVIRLLDNLDGSHLIRVSSERQRFSPAGKRGEHFQLLPDKHRKTVVERGHVDKKFLAMLPTDKQARFSPTNLLSVQTPQEGHRTSVLCFPIASGCWFISVVSIVVLGNHSSTK